MIKFYATHGRGLYHFCKTEIENLANKLRETDSTFYLSQCDYIEGKLSFETNINLDDLLTLTTIERLFYQILFEKFDTTPQEDQVMQMVNQFFAINSESQAFIDTFVRSDDNKQLENAKKIRKILTFRIDSKLTGKWKHNLTFKNELNELIRRKLLDLNFDQNLTNPDFILSCHLSQVSLIIGIPVSKVTISNRNSIKSIGLRSTICSAMIQLSEIKNQSNTVFVFDPFCGKSTILCELILQIRNRKIFYVSSDADKTQLDYSLENYGNLCPQGIQADFLLWNLTSKSQFPFRDGIFDSIITDLPFGKNHPIQYFENSASFYSKVISEFSRMLLKSGSCVILINSKEAVHFQDLVNSSRFELVSKHSVSLGETSAVIFKLSKLD